MFQSINRSHAGELSRIVLVDEIDRKTYIINIILIPSVLLLIVKVWRDKHIKTGYQAAVVEYVCPRHHVNGTECGGKQAFYHTSTAASIGRYSGQLGF